MVDASRVKRGSNIVKKKKKMGRVGSFTGTLGGYRSVQVVSPVPLGNLAPA